jgi:chemotaxis family two-component system response regulator PixG
MMSETITITDFNSKITALKLERFSGKLLLKDSLGQKWVIYLFLGRILYATGGIHPVRRWRRNLKLYCNGIEPEQLQLLTNIYSSSTETINIYWEYELLYSWVEQREINREQAVQIIGSIVAEVLFDVTQAMQITYQVEPENSSHSQLVLLDAEQVITEVKRVWQTWQEAKIADRSPNRAPVIKQPEQLQQKSSFSLPNPNKTTRWTAYSARFSYKMKRDVVEVTCSLIPYIQAGLVELIDIPDLAAPIDSTSLCCRHLRLLPLDR